MKIDSLRNALVFLHDSARVDCLNVLSLAYTYLNVDSAKEYAQNAYSEALRIQYVRGIATSLNSKAHIAGFGLHDFPLEEKLSRQTILLYKNIPDKKVLTETYLNLALSLFCQGYFDRSAAACAAVIQLSQNTDKKSLGEALAIMGSISFEMANYEKSFEYFNESLAVFKGINDSYNTAILLAKIGDLYRLAGDQKTALNFYFQSLEYPKGSSLVWHPLGDLGDTYYSLENYDSTSSDQEKYLQTIKSLTIKSNYMTFPKVLTAEAAIADGEYDKALTLLIEDLKTAGKNNDKNREMRLLLDMGKAYEGKKIFEKAFYYARNLLENAQSRNAKQYMRDGYKLMFILYDGLHKVDSAYSFYRKYTLMKDSVAITEFGKKLAISKAATENEKKQAQIELLDNEKLINQQKLQLSGQQLKSESFQKKILITGGLFMLLLGFIIFRNVNLRQKNEAHRHDLVKKELSLQKLESERIKADLKEQVSELEMQALRAQMNPHFIFNCLNSINRFTLANESLKAADYLTKFAKLIRIVLEQSGKSFIHLEDELYCLQLYMDLEALRFEIPFSYEIRSHQIDTSVVNVPPLLLQPFVENAIWHGLNPKTGGEGKIIIDLKLCNEILHCSICDNGVGRSHSAASENDSAREKKSLGIKLTRHRLELLEPSLTGREAAIVIEDKFNEAGQGAGTCVHIKIPSKSA